jgi:hypothetical protein
MTAISKLQDFNLVQGKTWTPQKLSLQNGSGQNSSKKSGELALTKY